MNSSNDYSGNLAFGDIALVMCHSLKYANPFPVILKLLDL